MNLVLIFNLSDLCDSEVIFYDFIRSRLTAHWLESGWDPAAVRQEVTS